LLLSDPFIAKGKTIEIFNQLESLLWFSIAFILIEQAFFNKKVLQYKMLMFQSAITFILFGISDLIEAKTGAWWMPWSLLVFKGACLITFVYLFMCYLKIKKSKT